MWPVMWKTDNSLFLQNEITYIVKYNNLTNDCVKLTFSFMIDAQITSGPSCSKNLKSDLVWVVLKVGIKLLSQT